MDGAVSGDGRQDLSIFKSTICVHAHTHTHTHTYMKVGR